MAMNLNKNKESIWEGLEEDREIVVSKIKEKKETNDFPTLHFEFFREILVFFIHSHLPRLQTTL